MKIIKVEDWEQSHINDLTLNLILYATIATLTAALLTVITHEIQVPQIQELIFAPWGVTLVIGTALAFHRGVMAERARAAAENEKKS